MNKATISGIVITRNEAPRIEKCLKALLWVDELLIIDNNSSDETVKIAQKFPVKIYQTQENNFAAIRNLGLKFATKQWILYIDADEIVPESLREEIKVLIDQNYQSENFPKAYYIYRHNFYMGKLWPVKDKMQRLFIKESIQKWIGDLHETAIVKGTMGELKEPLLHDTHRSLTEMLEKTNEWSLIEARLRFKAHHPPVVWWRLLRVMFTGFYTSFVKQQGWKAGTIGIIESLFQAFSMYITYAKLWELQQQK